MKDNIDMHFFQPKTEEASKDGLVFLRNFPKKFASQKCRAAEGFQSVWEGSHRHNNHISIENTFKI